MTIGENIRKLRIRHGLTQKQLADIAAVSDKAVSSWETGHKEPRMSALERIAKHFHIKKSELIDGEPSYRELLAYPHTTEVHGLGKQLIAEGCNPHLTVKQSTNTRIVNVPIMASVSWSNQDAIGLENVIDYYPMASTLLTEGEYFMLQAMGDHDFPSRIAEGDLLLFRKQCFATSGSLTLVSINGGMPCLRRLFHVGELFFLQYDRPKSEMSPYFPHEVQLLAVLDTIISKCV